MFTKSSYDKEKIQSHDDFFKLLNCKSKCYTAWKVALSTWVIFVTWISNSMLYWLHVISWLHNVFKLERNSGCHLVVIVTTKWQPKREKIYKTDKNSTEMNCHRRNYPCSILFTTKNHRTRIISQRLKPTDFRGFQPLFCSVTTKWQPDNAGTTTTWGNVTGSFF